MSCPAPVGSQRSQGHTWDEGGVSSGMAVLEARPPPPAQLALQPLLPGSPLTGGSYVAGFAEALGAATWKDAAHCEATKTGGHHTPALMHEHLCVQTGPASRSQKPCLMDPPQLPGRPGSHADSPAYLLEGTETGQGQLTQGTAGSSVPMRTKPAWQRSQWSPSVLCLQSWGGRTCQR